MNKRPDIIGIIPARGNSRGLPGKNIKLLNNKPLIAYTIEAASASRYLSRTIVSTESREIARIARGYDGEVVMRPVELAQDDTPTVAVIEHVLRHLEVQEAARPEIVVTLQPTSPLRKAADIDRAIALFLKNGRKSVVSVCPAEHPPHWMYTLEGNKLKPWVTGGGQIYRRQDAPETYRLNGAVYVTDSNVVLTQGTLLSNDIIGYVMPAARSIDIDSELDFQLAGVIIKKGAAFKKIRIGNKLVGPRLPCFIVAEAGVNHNGDINLAKKLVDAAKESGADAIKFQAFKTEALVGRRTPKAGYQKAGTEAKETQYDMLKRLELSNHQVDELFHYARGKDITFLCSSFDEESVDYMDSLGVPAFKIGSGDITHLPLLNYIAEKGRPVILSTGISTIHDISDALAVIRRKQADIILLHCVSQYPAAVNSMNLKAMETMSRIFSLPVGLSDHTPGITVPIAATALGACMIEKHLTIDRTLSGPDHAASLEPGEFGQMVAAIRDVEKAMGNGFKKPAAIEKRNLKVVRRSLVARVNIPAGAVLTREMVGVRRPGAGIEPKHLSTVIGKKVTRRVPAGSPLKWPDLE